MTSQLTAGDTQRLLLKLGDLSRQLVLIGGQAVNFWADLYAPKVEALKRDAPFTSKDIDFCGTTALVRQCALKLGGKAKVPTLDDHDVSNAGTVCYVDDEGTERVLDFLAAPFGQDHQDIFDTSVEAEILDEHQQSTELTFRVMHAERCFEGRILNEALENKKGQPLPLKQIRASIHCAREFTREILYDTSGLKDPVREALKLNERIFKFCCDNESARALYNRYGIDPAEAILLDPALPPMFRETRYHQIIQLVAERRV